MPPSAQATPISRAAISGEDVAPATVGGIAAIASATAATAAASPDVGRRAGAATATAAGRIGGRSAATRSA